MPLFVLTVGVTNGTASHMRIRVGCANDPWKARNYKIFVKATTAKPVFTRMIPTIPR